MLVAALAPQLAEDSVVGYRLRTPRVGEGEPLASASVDFEDDSVSRYSEFVATDAEGGHHAFVDVYLGGAAQ